ncbi:ABC transporter G family member 28 [Dorcoceras hygrometricum]|uniref:ABC transporter G family member 28 n=1 Tax=Dorcoceras hygrometricum TaxID=472368 RepID=A0A2Z7BYV5_9LAMI|nr:ABC transporter G family member 28 [Dorcoceras hygrometricum]
MAKNPSTRLDFGAFVEKFTLLPHPSPHQLPLTNLTFAVKDIFDVEGYVTGFGNPDWVRTHSVATSTAPVIMELLYAGAKCVGKTVMDEMAYSINGENIHYGTPVNPRAEDRVPGGSSSGSAVAVGAMLVDFSLGTDTGGSVRVPASYCGIYGFRPSHGIISTSGVIPMSQSFDTVGWFARDPVILSQVGKILLRLQDYDLAKLGRVIIAEDCFKLLNIPSNQLTEVLISSVQKTCESQTIDYISLGSFIDANVPILKHFINAETKNQDNNIPSLAGLSSAMRLLQREAEWNSAFNFSSDLRFVAACLAKTGDVTPRLCNAAEMEVYFNSLANGWDHIKPNRNCNSTHWVAGCEPGWACSTGSSDETNNFKNSHQIPVRQSDCQSCCEGFFCPYGITCMMPCPLGSYCPLATFNPNTSMCAPYSYKPPPGNSSHTCGGANVWTDARSSNELFCLAGSYCPSSSETKPCSSGNYCPMGSTDEKRCFKLTTCDAKTESQDIHAYGIMLIAALSTLLIIIYNCSDQILTTRERRHAKSREAAARTVREKTRARARWKAAKEAAKKHSQEFRSQFSGKFSKKNLPNSDQVKILNHTECETIQIFKYAYAQLEREKAQQQRDKDLTFSGVISMAMDKEPIKRPLIEISFRDLTVTLKGKHKDLLRSVTGKIRPGRITAIMGPSGAGKTTFLSALAGKAVGCTVSGMTFINGKAISIHSYKKIIGFVPQDDIVHGNLTVEENLWFSARCRLSADLRKPDKVLIVERVIDALGLQAIRGSLVGTVEKRGISGGQRKRVNVGLELVMEPSLLFLDEPTSGLDSSSSQLLLKALRREALEGVNICMVVHQPSYTLFQMFDDLILFARGGLTVYHGPVRNVEDYFSSLGINIPDRINPPDYFIDILEGMVNTTSSSEVNYTELPVRWMLHNGYPVPPDLRKYAGPGLSPMNGDHCHEIPGSVTEEQSFAGEVWQDVKCNVERQRDMIRHNFLRSIDLSNRRTPSTFVQYKYFLGRIVKQRLREAKTQAVDYLILLIAGACLGSLTKANDMNFGFVAYTYTIIAVSLLCKIAALRSFSLDKLQYWRESASGISSLAHFVSKDTVDLFNTLIKPVVYLSMFYFFSNPRSSFAYNYIVLLCLVYCVTGIGYVLAIFLEPGPSQLCSVLLPVVLTLISSQTNGSKFVKTVAEFCYPKWALEAFVIANAERYYGVWLLTRCGALHKYGYNVHHWILHLCTLILAGIICRAIAFIGMVSLQKK